MKNFQPPDLPPLPIKAARLVAGNYLGPHRSRRRGTGTEFAEYRAYRQGDPVKDVDWRVFARTDRLFIRLHEEELARRVWILLDDSPSMDFGEPETKFDRARLAAAAISILAERTGDAVGVLEAEAQDLLPASRGRGHRIETLRVLDGASPQKERKGAETDLARSLDRFLPTMRAGSLLVIFSDFLTDLSALERSLKIWFGRGGDVIAFHFLAKEEWESSQGAVRYWDPETGREFDVRSDDAWREYRRRLEAHITTVKTIFRRYGFDYGLIKADDDLRASLLRVVRRRLTTTAAR